MIKCRLKLDNNDLAVYCAGDLLKGTIELDLSQRIQLRALRFVVLGAAKCHWTKASTVIAEIEDKRRCRNKLKEFEGDEVFINHSDYLFGYQSASPVTMQIGTHSYEFSCHLPPTLPASFEGRFGCIEYHIRAVLDSSESTNNDFKFPFTVVRYDDLNKQPELKIPVNVEEIATFCCFCCISEPMTMTATLPYSGFAPGQRIPVTVNYVNKSDVEIIRTCITLKRFTRFNSTTPKIKTKTEEEKIAETFDYDGLGVNENGSFTKNLLIPQILPNTNVDLCKTVQISYELRVEAETAGFNFNVFVTIPIKIGTVPLKFDDTSADTTTFIDASAPPPDIPPPTYHETFHNERATTNSSENLPGIGWKVSKE